MAETSKKKIFVKWVRSGIGFTKRQKQMPRSLGLRRLHQVVSCPDTPQVRGLIQRIHHLVEVVDESKPLAWLSVPEYTILPPEVVEKPAPKARAAEAEEETAETAAQAEPKPSKKEGPKHEAAEGAEPGRRAAEPAKSKKAAKPAAAKHKEKAKAREAGHAKKKGKHEAAKSHHPSKKSGKK